METSREIVVVVVVVFVVGRIRRRDELLKNVAKITVFLVRQPMQQGIAGGGDKAAHAHFLKISVVKVYKCFSVKQNGTPS